MHQSQAHYIEQIFTAAVSAVQPEALIGSFVSVENGKIRLGEKTFPENHFNNINVAGAGKAAAAMALAVEKILGDKITEGIVSVKSGHALPLNRIKLIEAAHPIPNNNSVLAADAITSLFKRTYTKDLIIFLLSGGASSLITDIPEGCTLEELETIFNLLLNSGANITEMNIVRKHLSQIKGGQILRHSHGATIVTLIISDVTGNDLSVIGSGPTVGDDSTFAEAMAVIDKYNLRKKSPLSIIDYLTNGVNGLIAETPFSNDPLFRNTNNYIIGDNCIALEAACRSAVDLGYDTIIVDDALKGDAEEAAIEWANRIRSFTRSGKTCLITGGETTVKVNGNGKGGRNQQFALKAALELKGQTTITLLSAGTDGTDGPTDAAGAIINGETIGKAEKHDLIAEDYLKDNNAYHFFDKINSLVKTGPTHTNVMDIVITLIN